jgi:hypothetical protein
LIRIYTPYLGQRRPRMVNYISAPWRTFDRARPMNVCRNGLLIALLGLLLLRGSAAASKATFRPIFSRLPGRGTLTALHINPSVLRRAAQPAQPENFP